MKRQSFKRLLIRLKHFSFKRMIQNIKKGVTFFFTARCPDLKDKTTLWSVIMVYSMLAIGMLMAVFMPGFSVCGRIWRFLFFLLLAIIGPWVAYFAFHMLIPAIEGFLVAKYKIKEAWEKNERVKGFENFFIARAHYEFFGPLKRPVLDMERLRADKEEEYIRYLATCIVHDLKHFKCFAHAMSIVMMEDFVQKIIALKHNRITPETLMPISVEPVDIGPYELLVVIYNVFADAHSAIGFKVLSQHVSNWFPGNFPVANTVQTYFSRIGDSVKRRDDPNLKYLPLTKATKTEVPVLSKEDLLDPESYYIRRFRQTVE